MTVKTNINISTEINVIDNVREHCKELLYENMVQLKDRLCSNILNLELSILYKNKIYDEDLLEVQSIFLRLSDDVDNILNLYNKKSFEEINEAFEQVKDAFG